MSSNATFDNQADKAIAFLRPGQMKRFGVYTLANDAVYDWFVALVHSFRTYNTNIELAVIPFDKNISRLQSFCRKCDIVIFSPSDLEEYDAIGKRLYSNQPTSCGMFRKFAAFSGIFDHFLFLDADIVVLRSLDPLLELVRSERIAFAFADQDIDMVYGAGELRRRAMENDYFGFNAGLFASRKGLISKLTLSAMMTKVLPLRDQLTLTCGDQPIMNFCVHELGIVHQPFSMLVAGCAKSFWAKNAVRRVCGNVKGYVDEDGKDLYAVHWAGYRLTGMMPNLWLFLSYRLHSKSWMSKLTFRVKLHAQDVWAKRRALRVRARLRSLSKPKRVREVS